MSTLIYTNTKSKKKQNRKPGWQKAEAEHRAWLMKMGIDPDAKRKKKEFVVLKEEPSMGFRETKHYPSLGSGVGNATKKESPKYTGDLIVGIATMHKSNAVPVMRGTDQAKEISAMRR